MSRYESLSVFARVVELGSFAAAARELDLSPAMVGNHVRKLESWFDGPLLLRTTRQQALTDLGREVLARTRQVQAGMDALDEVASREGQLTGVLHISAPLGIGRRYIAPALRIFASRHPNLQIDLQLSDAVEDMVRRGLDLAVRSGPLLGNEASLVARILVRQNLFLVASPAYLAQHGMPRRLDELMVHKTVRYNRYGRPRSWYLQSKGEIRKLDPPTVFMVDNVEALYDAVCDGVGIGWLPEYLVLQALRRGTLKRVLPSLPPHVVDTYLVWPASKTPSLKARMAAEHLLRSVAEVFPGPMSPRVVDLDSGKTGTKKSGSPRRRQHPM